MNMSKDKKKKMFLYIEICTKVAINYAFIIFYINTQLVYKVSETLVPIR